MPTQCLLPTHLNLAAFCSRTTVLGPGIRAAVWVQGCDLHCNGCIATEWIPHKPAHLVPIDSLVDLVLSLDELDGLTLSGGEPMLQASALAEFVHRIRRQRPVNVICFTGYELDRLRNDPPAYGVGRLLSEVDLLVDGPYRRELNDGKGMRGSTNQHFHYLTSRLETYDFANWPRSVELNVLDGEILAVGIPPEKIHRLVNNLSFGASAKHNGGGI